MKENEDFNNAAESYDRTFTDSDIGKKQRDRVYFWLDKIQFNQRVKTVFEINCGTGYDAEQFYNRGLKVTATDGSSKMIDYAQKSRNNGIDFFQLDFLKIKEKLSPADVIFSNFGGLNCVDKNDLAVIIEDIAHKQEKGNLLAWVIMPKFCLIESFYLIFKLKFKQIFRRNTNKGIAVNVEGTSVKTYYHAPREVKKLLADQYKIKLCKPVAIFLPPSYLEPFFKKHSYLLKILDKLEKVFGQFSIFSEWADHYIIIAEKK